ncbi:DUF1987 domain-containing protein [Desulfobacterales bacterium HSG2]|nr:DUF1987 domain-containing protein [Desulfobacterales bacterium HSG2]
MKNLKLEATKYTPEISFDGDKNVLEIIGESYPENIAEFYAPVFSWLEEYLEQVEDQDVVFNMELVYFNSSSSKVLLDLFELLEEATDKGKNVIVNWIYEEEDEDTLEFGEEFQEDFQSLHLNLLQKNS